MAHSAKISISIQEGIIKKIHVTVATKSRQTKEPTLGFVPKNDEKKNSCSKGLEQLVKLIHTEHR